MLNFAHKRCRSTADCVSFSSLFCFLEEGRRFLCSRLDFCYIRFKLSNILTLMLLAQLCGHTVRPDIIGVGRFNLKRHPRLGSLVHRKYPLADRPQLPSVLHKTQAYRSTHILTATPHCSNPPANQTAQLVYLRVKQSSYSLLLPSSSPLPGRGCSRGYAALPSGWSEPVATLKTSSPHQRDWISYSRPRRSLSSMKLAPISQTFRRSIA